MATSTTTNWEAEQLPDESINWLLRTLFAEPVPDAGQVAA